eukprot:1655033-Pyramimonas_sp.AAC.1
MFGLRAAAAERPPPPSAAAAEALTSAAVVEPWGPPGSPCPYIGETPQDGQLLLLKYVVRAGG